MRSSHAISCALLSTAALAGGAAVAQAQNDLVSLDRIGSPDAANVMTFRVNPDQSNNAPLPDVAEGYANLYQGFAQAHPDWQIQLELMTTDIGQEHARMLEQARAGRAPDCASVDSFQLPLFIQQGVLKPVTEHFTQEEVDDLFPFVRETVVGEDSEVYAWWWNTDLRVLYRNADLVPEAPETWDEVQAAALAAKDQGVSDGIVFNGGRWEGATFDWLAYFWGQGGELLDGEGKPIFAEGENRQHMLDALNFFDQLVESGAAPERVSTITTYDDLRAAAIGGEAAMFFGGHWQYTQLEQSMEPEVFEKWQVSMLPGETPDQRSTGTGGWSIASFSDDPEKVALCMALVREVYMGPVNELVQQIPTRASLFDELPSFQTEFFGQMKEYLQYGQARPGFPIYPELSNQFQIMLGEVLSQEKDPEEALDDAAERVMDAYGKL